MIRHGVDRFERLTVWFARRLLFPGQLNFQRSFQRNSRFTPRDLRGAALRSGRDGVCGIPAFEPGISIPDRAISQSIFMPQQTLSIAYTLKVDLDTISPMPTLNEEIVAPLLMENKLVGFHFNDSKYGTM